MEYLKSAQGAVASGLHKERSSAFSDELRDGRKCPDCGAPMVLRVAKKGSRANKSFWGCSTVLRNKCRRTMNENQLCIAIICL